MRNIRTHSVQRCCQTRVCAVHLRLEVHRHHSDSCDVTVICDQPRLGCEVPAQTAIRAHDELEVPLEGLAGAQHLGILRGVGLGELGREEVLHRAPDDVASTPAHPLGEASIDVQIPTARVLGRGHHLR